MPLLRDVYRSHKTTEYTNYFDNTDARIRNHPWSLDAQLLNAPASLLEWIERKAGREIDSRYLETCPLNLDNLGVYFRSFIPPSFSLPLDETGQPAPPRVVKALPKDATDFLTLLPYDDTLPIPTRIGIDSARSPIPYSSPILTSFEGTGFPQEADNVTLNVPTKLWFTLSDMGNSASPVEITITGQASPQPFSFDLPSPRIERVIFNDEGIASSRIAWSSILSISVRGLPAGAKIECTDFLFNSLLYPDTSRPFTHPAWRQRPFQRYWSIEGKLLKESYIRNRFTGPEYIQSYYVSGESLSALCLEPNTYGLYTASGSTLYYTDRREPVPLFLNRTGITAEPLYGLDVAYDVSKPGDQRNVLINAYPYRDSSSLSRYRILLETPSTVDQPQVLLANGTLAPLSPVAGWRPGPPSTVGIPLGEGGTYVFTLEMVDSSGNSTKDIVPYANFNFTPIATFDLSSSVPAIKGIGFDHKQQLWIWTGQYLVPMSLTVDGYLFDSSSSSLYFTQQYQAVQISQ
jgi:hypothetical protein